MIIGVGTDIIEIGRVKKAIDRNKMFLEKIFTKMEIEMFKERSMRMETIAGNFAAKEAVSKAIGTGFRGFSFIDIEILRDELGKPVINVSEKVKEVLDNKNSKFSISISHNRDSAIAFVVLEVL